MYIEKVEDGIWLRDLPVWVVDTLLCLPEWIETDNPAVRDRLMPKAYKDDAQDAEWRSALGDSLEHLFAGRTAIVRGDLKNLAVSVPDFELIGDSDEDQERLVSQTLFNVCVPAAHVSAWVSTLQAGTHALFILEGLTAQDMERELDESLPPEKQISMMRLSVLQEILVRMLD